MKMIKKMQSVHDSKVIGLANMHKGLGCKVRAHAHGFKRPAKIQGRIPDLDVRCFGKRKIIEVETLDSLSKDIKQQQVFRNFAAKRKNTIFKIALARG